jgi:hypothetical protein
MVNSINFHSHEGIIITYVFLGKMGIYGRK